MQVHALKYGSSVEQSYYRTPIFAQIRNRMLQDAGIELDEDARNAEDFVFPWERRHLDVTMSMSITKAIDHLVQTCYRYDVFNFVFDVGNPFMQISSYMTTDTREQYVINACVALAFVARSLNLKDRTAIVDTCIEHGIHACDRLLRLLFMDYTAKVQLRSTKKQLSQLHTTTSITVITQVGDKVSHLHPLHPLSDPLLVRSYFHTRQSPEICKGCCVVTLRGASIHGSSMIPLGSHGP